MIKGEERGGCSFVEARVWEPRKERMSQGWESPVKRCQPQLRRVHKSQCDGFLDMGSQVYIELLPTICPFVDLPSIFPYEKHWLELFTQLLDNPGDISLFHRTFKGSISVVLKIRKQEIFGHGGYIFMSK